MAKYAAINQEHQDRQNKLFNDCHVFWAFSNKQFDEGKAKNPLQPGEKYVSIGMGGYLPKSHIEELKTGLATLKKWKSQAIKAVKADEAILYELNNHECFYTGDITDAMPVLEDLGYTEEQVKAVYHKNREFALN